MSALFRRQLAQDAIDAILAGANAHSSRVVRG